MNHSSAHGDDPPTGCVSLARYPTRFHRKKEREGEKKTKVLPSFVMSWHVTPCNAHFGQTSDCLIGVRRCVCQGCWQNRAAICIKPEGVQISLLFCVLLPSLHPKEKSACNSQRETLAGRVQRFAIGSDASPRLV